MNKPIVIATSKVDEPTYKPVAEILTSNGYPVITYQSDRVFSGEDQYVLDLSEDGTFLATYNGISIHPGDLSAAWYRKVNSFALPYLETQLANHLYINREMLYLQDMMWGLYPEDIWLGSPNNIALADRKLKQQLVAHEVGFTIARTLISGDWQEVISRLLPNDQYSWLEDELGLPISNAVAAELLNIARQRS